MKENPPEDTLFGGDARPTFIQRILIRIAERRGITICPGCLHEIYPTVCHCGELKEGHGTWNTPHGFCPAGCTCGYDQADKMRLTTWQLFKLVYQLQ